MKTMHGNRKKPTGNTTKLAIIIFSKKLTVANIYELNGDNGYYKEIRNCRNFFLTCSRFLKITNLTINVFK